jgi:hypothetical protein
MQFSNDYSKYKFRAQDARLRIPQRGDEVAPSLGLKLRAKRLPNGLGGLLLGLPEDTARGGLADPDRGLPVGLCEFAFDSRDDVLSGNCRLSSGLISGKNSASSSSF